ncbi:MAG: hypothetical protein AAGG68_31010, partial [Bacteroidota bacterium]
FSAFNELCSFREQRKSRIAIGARKGGLEEKHNILLTAKCCVSPPNPPLFRRKAAEKVVQAILVG